MVSLFVFVSGLASLLLSLLKEMKHKMASLLFSLLKKLKHTTATYLFSLQKEKDKLSCKLMQPTKRKLHPLWGENPGGQLSLHKINVFRG